MNIHTLKAERSAKQTEMRALAGREAAGETLGDGERARFDALDTETRALEDKLNRAERVAQFERAAHAEPVSGHADMASLERRFSVGKALSEIGENGRLTGAELEFSQQHRSGRPGGFAMPASAFLESRAVTTTSPAGGPGGALVATMLGPEIDRLRPLLAIQSLGATVLSGLVGNLTLPRLKTSGSAGWVPEHTDATGSDPAFDTINMSPKTVTARYEMSRRLMQQAPQLEGILRADIGYLLAQQLDLAAIIGGGANQPSGIMANASVPVLALGTNGATINSNPVFYSMTADLIGMVEQANETGPTGFLTNATIKRSALKLQTTVGEPIPLAELFHDEKVVFSNQVPNNLTKGTGTNLNAIIYGNWQSLILAYWSAVDIVINPYADAVASKGGAFLHAFLDADIALRHPESFAICKDAAP